ncbi:phage tail sheath family protein [Bacterioplanoides sp.]|uniref:phage tail sheath family protein n=1 Tax=Bacterioplanoides sp. TaxID=2066072 RepID=UPI003B5BB5DE
MPGTAKTPGVYINEANGFPNSVVPIATAVPAFIGYTPKAEYEGKSYRNKAQKISSFSEFKAIYMLEDPALPADPVKQYQPEYYLVPQKVKPESGDYVAIGGKYYSVLPDPTTIYYMYNAIRLFFENGGGDAYIVSVGGYGDIAGKPMDSKDTHIVNPNVQLADLKKGLEPLMFEQEPTMYYCPDATLMPADKNGTVMQLMLLQAEKMQTVVCLFDVIGGRAPDPVMFPNDIQNFRNSTGSQGLKYGTAYYPFVNTTIMGAGEIDFTSLFGGDVSKLADIINPSGSSDPVSTQLLEMIESPKSHDMTNKQLHTALMNANKHYALIIKHATNDANVLPPCGGMAGIYAVNDQEKGVWHAPANVSMVGVSGLPLLLNDHQQEDLNVDAISGKSINAIRFFNGQGILVWGARTLDGNSEDWRYVSVRRTMTFLEQSVKLAARAYVFEPNDANTWSAVESMISGFLTSIWKEGGLQGASAAEAFQVEIGLGSTMTAEDLLNGYMNITVKVAVVRPAEFIEITFQQEMAKSG